MKKTDLSQILKTLIILIVLFAAFFRFFELNMPDVIEDEDAHIRDAIAYYHNDPFVVPRHHPFKHTPGNMGHPFFHHFLIFFSYKIFNPSYASSRLPAGIMSLIAALSVYYISRKMFNQKTALIASSLYLMSALPFRHARTANVDCTFAAFGGLSIYYFYKYLQDRKLFDALFCWHICSGIIFNKTHRNNDIYSIWNLYSLTNVKKRN